MKKLFFILALALTTQFTFAQDASFKADMKKFLELSGANDQIELAKDQIIGMIAADKKDAFLKEFNESLKPIIEAQQEFYMTEFTQAEIKELIKFYESPLGKKMSNKASKMTETMMPIIQKWSMSLQSLIMKYQ